MKVVDNPVALLNQQMRIILKRLNIFFSVFCVSITVGAQITLRDVWLSMPDEMIPYLNKNLRLEHLDFVDMGVKSEVNNQMNGICLMDTLTDDYTHITLTPSSYLELRLLPVNDSTKIICVVKTLTVQAQESDIRFYDIEWKPLIDTFGLNEMKNQDGNDALKLKTSFIHRPDTMSIERFEELSKLVDPVMLSAKFDLEEPVLTFALSPALATKEEKGQLKSILRHRRFRWNGNSFSEI